MFHKNGLLALDEVLDWNNKKKIRKIKIKNIVGTFLFPTNHKRIPQSPFASERWRLRNNPVGHVMIIIETVGEAVGV